MSKNKISNLNDLLMVTIQNLVDPEVDQKGKVINEMTAEKAVAIAKVGSVIIQGVKVQLQAVQLMASKGLYCAELPEFLDVKDMNKKLKENN